MRTKSGSRSCSPRVIGSMPAASRASTRRLRGAGDPAQRRAQCLAAVRERGVDDREDLLPGDRGGRRVATGPGDQAGVDVRCRPEDVAADRPGPAYVGEPGGLHRRDAVDLRAGPRGQPVGHLRLHHHQAVLERGQQGEQVQQHRHRHVVGQVGDQRGRRRAGDRGDPHGVRLDHLEPVGVRRGPVGDRGGQGAGQRRVDLDRDHPRGHVEQAQGERAETGTDLEDDVRRDRCPSRARCAAPCSGRSRSSARAAWSAAGRAQRPVNALLPDREVSIRQKFGRSPDRGYCRAQPNWAPQCGQAP